MGVPLAPLMSMPSWKLKNLFPNFELIFPPRIGQSRLPLNSEASPKGTLPASTRPEPIPNVLVGVSSETLESLDKIEQPILVKMAIAINNGSKEKSFAFFWVPTSKSMPGLKLQLLQETSIQEVWQTLYSLDLRLRYSQELLG